jgi:type II secretory pathway component PulF
MGDSLGPFNMVFLAFPGFALWLAVRIMYGRRAYAAADPLKILLSVASRLLFVLALLGFVIGLIGLWWMLIPFTIITAIVLLMALDRYRHGEHRALIWTLASAAQRGVPLPEAARAFADEARDDTGTRALALAQSLERGQPLWEAARVARLRMTTPMRLAVRLGEALGMLGQAMRRQIEDSSEVDAMMRRIAVRFFWLYVILVVLCGMLTYVMFRIVPVFQKMFEEFGLKLPTMTQTLIDFTNWFMRYGWFLTAPLTLVLSLVTLALGLWKLSYLLGWFPRDLPLVWRFFKRYDGAIVMRGLSLAIRRGMTLPDGLYLLGATYPIRHVAQQLHWAAARTKEGGDWRQAIVQTGLIAPADGAVLAAAERVGNLPWALDEMADSALRRQVYRLQIGLQLLFPAAVVLLGMLIAYIVLALFLPLISLIQGLS